MTSLQRVQTTLCHKEPDRVPFFIPATLRGARELGISIREYFSRAEHIVEAQIRFCARYRHDLVTNFFYGGIEVEAWGAEIIYFEDGPPNTGMPFIRAPDDIRHLKPPSVRASACLSKVLKATEMLKNRITDVPILGVAISPFSLPVMQMGFDRYIDLIYEQPQLFWQLMQVNEEFCVEWANAQLEAGATVIAYVDPVSSPTIIPKEMYMKTGFEIAKRTISKIKGPMVMHMASGRCLHILREIEQTGISMIAACAFEDLAEIKTVCDGRLTIIGNLNNIGMRHWTPKQTEAYVMDAIARAGAGGGYILSDTHGEIPWQVPENVLMTISEAVYTWGNYPLDWAKDYGK
jgi:uroporphyrinogen decarboxylase